MDVQFLRAASGTLAIVAVLLVLVVLFAIRSIAAKVLTIVLLASAVFGLVHYRGTLERCDRRGCACKLFGENVPGTHCNPHG